MLTWHDFQVFIGVDAILRAWLVALLCTVGAGCANGWPSARHPQPASAQAPASCKTTSSRILHSDCSTTTPATRITGDELDREQQSHGNGSAIGGIVTPH